MQRVLLLLLLIQTLSMASGFVAGKLPRIRQKNQPSTISNKRTHHPSHSTLKPSSRSTTEKFLMIRGGGDPTTIVPVLTSALHSGPYGILALWAVASAVVIPATIYRQGFSFSVGYGYSVFAMALVLGKVFAFSPLVVTAAIYGARLGTYLLLRGFASPEKAAQIKSFDKSPRLQRIPFAASVALFYAFLMTPVLYVLRFTGSDNVALQAGTIIALVGAIMEGIADTQKFIVKQSSQEARGTFVGPTSGVYRLTRHPNYTGEVLFWFGLLVSGVPTFGKSIVAWVASLVGFYGIYGIMTSATKRLDERQLESYGGQEKYDAWRTAVKAPIFVFFNKQ